MSRKFHPFSTLGLVCVGIVLLFVMIVAFSGGNAWIMSFAIILSLFAMALLEYRECEVSALLLFLAFSIFTMSPGIMEDLVVSLLLIIMTSIFAVLCIPCLLNFERCTINVNPEFDIDLAEGEIVLRTYKITELDFTPRYGLDIIGAFSFKNIWANGFAILTNRRLFYTVDSRFYRAMGLKNMDILMQQIYIEDIMGVDYTVSTAVSP
ncbi:hypothetical protein [Methanomethylophilus alvi]|uniref:hypothetical protein n=1 Tax=Methanomethylophilus alvi TaxID=1291540 RepID=UPI0037DC3B53